MDKLSVIGLDLAKSVFQVHVADGYGKKVLAKQLKRAEVLRWFAALPPSVVGMEASGGAHEWARQLQALGHQVKLMAPQHVKLSDHLRISSCVSSQRQTGCIEDRMYGCNRLR
jgi:transposase